MGICGCVFVVLKLCAVVASLPLSVECVVNARFGAVRDVAHLEAAHGQDDLIELPYSIADICTCTFASSPDSNVDTRAMLWCMQVMHLYIIYISIYSI